MWSEDLDVIIVFAGDDRGGHGGHDDTSEDLSTRHCEEKLFLSISCGLNSGQELSVCPISHKTHRLLGENWFHTVVRPISHGSTCRRCSGTGTRTLTRRMIHKKAAPDDEMDVFL